MHELSDDDKSRRELFDHDTPQNRSLEKQAIEEYLSLLDELNVSAVLFSSLSVSASDSDGPKQFIEGFSCDSPNVRGNKDFTTIATACAHLPPVVVDEIIWMYICLWHVAALVCPPELRNDPKIDVGPNFVTAMAIMVFKHAGTARGYMQALQDSKQATSRRGAAGRRLIGATTRERTREEAVKIREKISRSEAAQRIADSIGKDRGTVLRLLSKMFRGQQWEERNRDESMDPSR